MTASAAASSASSSSRLRRPPLRLLEQRLAPRRQQPARLLPNLRVDAIALSLPLLRGRVELPRSRLARPSPPAVRGVRLRASRRRGERAADVRVRPPADASQRVVRGDVRDRGGGVLDASSEELREAVRAEDGDADLSEHPGHDRGGMYPRRAREDVALDVEVRERRAGVDHERLNPVFGVKLGRHHDRVTLDGRAPLGVRAAASRGFPNRLRADATRARRDARHVRHPRAARRALHRGQQQPVQKHRREVVDLQRRLERVRRVRARGGRRRVVHEHVDRRPVTIEEFLADDGGRERARRRERAEVERERDRAKPSSRAEVDHAAVASSAPDDDARASRREHRRGLAAEPAAAAGHDRVHAAEVDRVDLDRRRQRRRSRRPLVRAAKDAEQRVRHEAEADDPTDPVRALLLRRVVVVELVLLGFADALPPLVALRRRIAVVPARRRRIAVVRAVLPRRLRDLAVASLRDLAHGVVSSVARVVFSGTSVDARAGVRAAAGAMNNSRHSDEESALAGRTRASGRARASR
eukprot:30200-Pelagococcus_subviridis.AAC.2